MTPRCLVVGTGFGCRIQVPALRAAGFDVVGLVGTDATRTAERARLNGVAEAFTDLDDAIGRTGATAVAVAAPPTLHAPLALAAIARGCHVLCEKPFAATLDEARRMLAAAERAGIVHMIGHEFRFVPQRALVARVIADGLIGEPRFVVLAGISSYVASFTDDLPDWWLDPQRGGGWLGASGSHIVDQVRSELGEFASVSAALPHVSTLNGSVEDSFLVRFRLASGADGVMAQTAGAGGPPAALFRVAGTRGTLWTEDDAVWVADAGGTRALDLPADLQLPRIALDSDDPRRGGVEWQFLTAIELDPYTRLCATFRAAIEGRPSPSSVRPATFADGAACMEVLDAVRASARDGGAVVAIGGTAA